MDFVEPLSDFLEFSGQQKQILKKRLQQLQGSAALPTRKAHSLVQYKECKDKQLGVSDCYQKIEKKVDRFLRERAFMWPTFAANGFNIN